MGMNRKHKLFIDFKSFFYILSFLLLATFPLYFLSLGLDCTLETTFCHFLDWLRPPYGGLANLNVLASLLLISVYIWLLQNLKGVFF